MKQSNLKQIETMIWESMVKEQPLSTAQILLFIESTTGRKIEPRWEKRYKKEIEKLRVKLRQRRVYYKKRAEEIAQEIEMPDSAWVFRWIMNGWINLGEISNVRHLIRVINERDIALGTRGNYQVPIDGAISAEEIAAKGAG